MSQRRVSLLISNLLILGVAICNAQHSSIPHSRWQFPIPEFHERFFPRTGRMENQPFSSDTSGFTLLGAWKWGRSDAVAVRDTLLYMGNGSLLQIYSIADTTSPRLLGEVDLPSVSIQAIALKDSMVYLAAGYVVAVSVQNPRAPRFVDSVDLFATPTRIAVVDSFLYVVTFSGTFCVVDISEPTTLVRRGSVPMVGERAYSVAARPQGRYAYGGTVELPPVLSIFDARNADAPVRRDYPLWTAVGSALVVDTLLFIGGGDGLSQGAAVIVYSVAQDSFPRRLAHVNTPMRTLPALAISDTILFLAEGDSVKAVAVANPSNPRMLLGVRNPRPNISATNQMSASHDHVFATQGRGVWALLSKGQDTLQEQWFFPTGSAATAITLEASLAFVACFRAGLWILNVANLDSITPMTNVVPSGSTFDVVVVNQFACIVTSTNDTSRGVRIYDVSNPFNPTLVSQYVGVDDYPSSGVWPALSYTHNMLVVTKPGLQDSILAELVNISDPWNPARVGIVVGAGFARGVLVRDTLLFLATSTGFRIFSVADPSRPNLLSVLAGDYSGVEVQGSYLYTTNVAGFHVVDISTPSSPQMIGSLGIAGSPSLAYSNGFVFGGNFLTFYAIDVRSPNAPHLSQTYSLPYDFVDVTSANDTLYLALAYGGVRVLRHCLLTGVQENPQTTILPEIYLSPNYPNPFNSQTTIEFALPSDQLITIKLYDILGREVRGVFQGKAERGKHAISIDLGSLSSGMYFCQLLTESGKRVSKPMVLMK